MQSIEADLTGYTWQSSLWVEQSVRLSEHGRIRPLDGIEFL